MLKLMVSGLLFVIGAATTAHAQRAQVTVDVAKITCDQFTSYRIATPRDIAIWLSGYYNGKRGNTVLDTEGLDSDTAKLRDYCLRNPQVPVMQAIETVVG